MLILDILKPLAASLLLSIATTPIPAQALEPRWLSNLLSEVKYFPEDESLVKRHFDKRKELWDQTPVGVRKMNEDEGEMFFLEYWRFDSNVEETTLRDERILKERMAEPQHLPSHADEHLPLELRLNSTSLPPLQAPLLLHNTQEEAHNGPLSPRAVLYFLNKRSYQCPTGTASCDSINRPNSCCPTGEACQLITDVGTGDVGCCAGGQSCSNQVSSCRQDYTSCPGNAGGGCCIPGYTCNGVGCKESL